MKTQTNQHHLESFKAYPYVAWILVGLFIVSIYHISVKLERATKAIEAHTEQLQTQAKQRPEDIKDFSRPNLAP